MIMEIVAVLIKIVMILAPVLLTVAYLTYLERKIIGRMQVRLGPTRVGPFGLLQPIADGLKLFFKEDIVPTKADKVVFILAPIIVLVPSLILFSVIPFAEHFYITNLNIGLLYLLSVASLGVYGVVLSGWASNSKYAVLGGLRAAAQMVSYEVFLGFALIGPVMMSGTLNLVDFVNKQEVWYIVCQP
ncbi:MAG: NADH-quinone oxidoreductase subunit H, partial [Nitrospinae bacterium]|nr:NADH-quinone oxidoreductase subunit H [Nitrospinota bacterium]